MKYECGILRKISTCTEKCHKDIIVVIRKILSITERRHRRRIKDRRQGTGRRYCLGEEFIKFLAALAVLHWTIWLQDYLHQDDLKEKDKFILFFKIILGKIASAARNLIHSSPLTEATTFAFSSVFILLLCRKVKRPGYFNFRSVDELQFYPWAKLRE